MPTLQSLGDGRSATRASPFGHRASNSRAPAGGGRSPLRLGRSATASAGRGGGNASGNCPKNKERVSWCSFFLLCVQVEAPRVQPKLSEPFLGFTQTAEIWNSRACMIGLIGTFIVELVLNKGILQMIGVEVGKGLDLPL
ncbi:Light-harvesting complex-like protein OHP1, chloroplastic [Zea mays]|uniref:Light-harvesting complex-like protein OHP1, chloroplastic n=1 Tax=Zea mays TaxID=4577 RepID=A0A3L6DNE2_MAIZE|nr:Light-harvesting complex-like protein OHP1, chloroplastic [Zea mays]